MKRCFHLLYAFLISGSFVLFPAPTFSQNPKGAITTNEQVVGTGKTRALVIGISRYQFIDSLQYADTDAEVFAEYLRSSSFWNIDKEDITLLVNDKAKYGDLTVQLQQTALQCKPGDNLLFYFSGHGDVETNTLFNRGFLLAQDTYSSNYMANGLRVDDLKDLFVTLLTNNVKVIVITDACRSGKLSGGMKGAEFTAAAIKSIWRNEIKILSSQPGQLSYEDRKWGNGRGVFSYYLINGLNGEADANKDSLITLAELEMYVGVNVSKETDYKQQPIFEGPNKFSTVIAKTGQRKTSVTNKAGNSVPVNLKTILPAADSCDYFYTAMTKAINESKLVSPANESATYYYRQVKRCSPDNSFTLKANAALLSALMNSSQETVNNSFIGKSLVSQDRFKEAVAMIDEVFNNNDLKLPNMQHWKNLQRYLYVLGEATWNDRSRTEILEKIIDTASTEEPDAAYLLTAKASVEMKKKNWEAAIKLLDMALAKSPGWLMPKYFLGICYGNKKNYRKALGYYEEILQKDTSYQTFECTKCILLKMAEYALKTKQDARGIEYLFRNIDMFPDHGAPYEVLYVYAVEKKDTTVAVEFIKRLQKDKGDAQTQLLILRFENEFYGKELSPEALKETQALLKNNRDSADYFYTLGLYYHDKKNYDIDSVLYYYQQAALLDSTEAFYLSALGSMMEEEGLYDEIVELLAPRLQNFSDDEKPEMMQLLINAYFALDKMNDAFLLCKELVSMGYMTCNDLRKFRKSFKDLPEYEKFIKFCKDQD